jgi:hypothetical protein
MVAALFVVLVVEWWEVDRYDVGDEEEDAMSLSRLRSGEEVVSLSTTMLCTRRRVWIVVSVHTSRHKHTEHMALPNGTAAIRLLSFHPRRICHCFHVHTNATAYTPTAFIMSTYPDVPLLPCAVEAC